MVFLLLVFSALTLEVHFQLKNCLLPNAFKMKQNMNIQGVLFGLFIFPLGYFNFPCSGHKSLLCNIHFSCWQEKISEITISFFKRIVKFRCLQMFTLFSNLQN